MASAGALVLFQIRQADQIDVNAIYFRSFAAWVTLLKVDSIDGAEDFQPNWRHAHANDMLWLLKEGLVQLRNVKAELTQSVHEPGRILVMVGDPDIETTGCPRKAVMPDRVSADKQIFNLRRAKQL